MRKRLLKKKAGQFVSGMVDRSILLGLRRYSCFAIGDSASSSLIIIPAKKNEIKQFKRKLTKHYFSYRESLDLVSLIAIDSDFRSTEKLEISRKIVSSFEDSEEKRIINMALLIQLTLRYMWQQKESAPNVLYLIIFVRSIYEVEELNEDVMRSAYETTLDKRTKLDRKLSQIDISFLRVFRKAMRVLIMSNVISRTVFNTVWDTKVFKQKLSLPEYGSFSYLPVAPKERSIP